MENCFNNLRLYRRKKDHFRTINLLKNCRKSTPIFFLKMALRKTCYAQEKKRKRTNFVTPGLKFQNSKLFISHIP